MTVVKATADHLHLNTSLAQQPGGLGQCTYSLVEDKVLRYIL